MKYRVKQAGFFGEGKNAALVDAGAIVEGPEGLEKDYPWLERVGAPEPKSEAKPDPKKK